MRKTMRRRKQGWIGLAGQLRSGAGAVIFARFDRAGRRGRAMPKRPDTLSLCFAAAAGRQRRGEPGPRTVRRLTDAAKARPSPVGGRAAADQLRLDRAYREFRGSQALDGEDAAAALPPPGLPPAFEALLEPSRYKAAFGGRGSGKSHAFAELLVRRCIEAAPLRAVCIREMQRSLDQSVKRLIEDKIQALGLGRHFRVQADRILTPGGGRIIFQGMQNHTAESIKSLEGYDIAWVEEAQALSIRSLDLLRPTIRKPGSELWFSWNPTRADDPTRCSAPGRRRPARCWRR
jgi:phage terminase large subunit